MPFKFESHEQYKLFKFQFLIVVPNQDGNQGST